MAPSGLVGHRVPPVDRSGSGLPGDDHQREDGPGDQDHRLHHVGPDHRLDATQHGVDGGQHADRHQYHHRPGLETEVRSNQAGHAGVSDVGDGHRSGQDDHSHPEQSQHEYEQDAGQLSGPAAEAAIEILVDAGQLQFHQEGQPDETDHQEHERHHQPGQGHRRTVLDHFAGRGEVGDRREQRGHDRETDGQPGHLPSADEVVFAVGLVPGEIHTYGQHTQQVDSHHDIIEALESTGGIGRKRGGRRVGE